MCLYNCSLTMQNSTLLSPEMRIIGLNLVSIEQSIGQVYGR